MTEHHDHEGKAVKPLPSFRLETLKKRGEFKAASGGARFSTKAFTMLRRPVPAGEDAPGLRFGFTVTKKVGNAVERNRIRRRLRAAVRASAAAFPPGAMDLVILARREAIALDFAAMVADVTRAVSTLAVRVDRRNPSAPAKNRPDNGNPVLP